MMAVQSLIDSFVGFIGDSIGEESSPSSSSSSLFSSLTDSTVRSPQDVPPPPPPTISTVSQPSTPSSHPPPIYSSTPLNNEPNTQQFARRLAELRTVEGIDAIVLQRENEEIKSEMVALRLQLEEQQFELDRLRSLIPKQHQQQPSAPNPAPPANDYQHVISKSQQKKIRKKERIEAANAAADTTQPPGCSSVQLLSLPPPQPPISTAHPPEQQQRQQQQSPVPNLFVFHDSNLKGCSTVELKAVMDKINKDNKQQTTPFNIILHDTYTLPQTLAKIKHTTFNKHDAVVINILTNDARQTKTRQRRTPTQTKQLQTGIIQHLISYIPPRNITILESPPLLDSPTSDIYLYNHASYTLSQQFGIHFSGTLIGEQHLWSGDGYHINRKFQPLLLKSLASAAVGTNPRSHYGLARPPYGQYGPWAAPKGQGMMPSFRDRALAQPLHFRRLAPIYPLMRNTIRRP